jgi:hypothetical protein
VVLGNGTVAFFDGASVRVSLFDSTGKRSGQFGGRGSGPGEFAPMGQWRTPGGATADTYFLTLGRIGDTLWVYDRGQRRFTVVAPDARILRTKLLGSAGPGTSIAVPSHARHKLLGFTPVALYGSGDVLGEAVFGAEVAYLEADGGRGVWWDRADSAYAVLSTAGTLARLVAPIPQNSATAVVDRLGVPFNSVYVPFATPVLRDASATGERVVVVTTTVTSATGGTYSVSVRDGRGNAILDRSYPFTSPPVSARQRDSAYAVIEQIASSRPADVAAELLEKVRAQMPRVMPVFNRLLAGVDGTVWLGSRQGANQRWLILTPSGDHAGVVLLPQAQALVEGTRSRLWVTERDGDGFVSIVRYRIEGR